MLTLFSTRNKILGKGRYKGSRDFQVGGVILEEENLIPFISFGIFEESISEEWTSQFVWYMS